MAVEQTAATLPSAHALATLALPTPPRWMTRARSHLYFAPIRVWHVWLVNRATAASRTRRILHVTAHAANAKQSVLLAIPTTHRKWPWKASRAYDVSIDQWYQYHHKFLGWTRNNNTECHKRIRKLNDAFDIGFSFRVFFVICFLLSVLEIIVVLS
ncbi:hypothetical protein HU200_000190 [Digitaria exilis]|uniref:Uncharacterized protein n=1 Tax=Digitaria exilis TaxID=1010633 RepID=A0A835G1R6_9POAL|nr:hypothetical protein HU200_000190 [Digitaria exilis]